MAKVLKFPEDRRLGLHVQKLKAISDKIDGVVIDALVEQHVDPHELAGLIAHRLGTLLRGFDDKSKTWDVCERVAKKQAVID